MTIPDFTHIELEPEEMIGLEMVEAIMSSRPSRLDPALPNGQKGQGSHRDERWIDDLIQSHVTLILGGNEKLEKHHLNHLVRSLINMHVAVRSTDTISIHQTTNHFLKLCKVISNSTAASLLPPTINFLTALTATDQGMIAYSLEDILNTLNKTI
jgi:hypothetical protein